MGIFGGRNAHDYLPVEEVYPLICRHQSGVLVLFPALPAELSQENGERGSNGEKEMLRYFL